MFRVPIAITALLMLVATTSQVAFAKERTPPGSFLTYRATSVAELVNEVNTDPVARARLANHFGVAQGQLAEYFAARLKLVSLTSPLKAQVWYVSKGNSLQVKTKLLPKGTPVFVTHEGTPLILWSCGNPMRKVLPEALVISEPEPPIEAVEVKPAPIETIAAAAVSAVPAPVTAAALPAAVPVVTDLAVASTVSVPPMLGGLGVLSLLGGLVAHGSDSTPWVPEPSGLAAVATGLLAVPFAAAVRRNRSN